MNVYVIASEGGMCKIGKADEPAKRLRELATGHPYKLTVARVFPCDDAHDIERSAHRLLAPRRMTGEWFSVTPQEASDVIERLLTPIGPLPAPPSPVPLTQWQAMRALMVIGMLADEQRRLVDAVAHGRLPGAAEAAVDAAKRIAEYIGLEEDDDDL